MTRLISFKSRSQNSSPTESPKDTSEREVNQISHPDSLFSWSMRGSRKAPLKRSGSGGLLDPKRVKKQSLYDEVGMKMQRCLSDSNNVFTCCAKKDIYYYFNYHQRTEEGMGYVAKSNSYRIKLPSLNLSFFK